MDTEHYLRYWGKAGAGGEFHLLAFHSLDVAACGQVLLQRHDPLRHLLAARLGLDEATLQASLIFMLALHDIGKFSYRFQLLRKDFPALYPDLPPERQYHPRHDTLGAILWLGLLEQVVLHRFVAESARSRRMETALGCWMSAVLPVVGAKADGFGPRLASREQEIRPATDGWYAPRLCAPRQPGPHAQGKLGPRRQAPLPR
jgi:CRISPR-associated endonuclease/helicase Cas3